MVHGARHDWRLVLVKLLLSEVETATGSAGRGNGGSGVRSGGLVDGVVVLLLLVH